MNIDSHAVGNDAADEGAGLFMRGMHLVGLEALLVGKVGDQHDVPVGSDVQRFSACRQRQDLRNHADKCRKTAHDFVRVRCALGFIGGGQAPSNDVTDGHRAFSLFAASRAS